MNMNNHTVYELHCPIENVVKYVGMSKEVHKRYLHHCAGHGKRTKTFVSDLKARGLRPTLKVVSWELSKEEALSFEHALTKFYMDNGTNIINVNIGSKRNPEEVEKWASTRRGKKVRPEVLEALKARQKIRYAEGPLRENLVALNEVKKKSVMDQHGNVYESMRSCTRVTGLRRASILDQLQGKREHVQGFRFKYV